MSFKKSVHIIGGGTIAHIRPHMALCAPAYGTVARQLGKLCNEIMPELDTFVHLTKMAGGAKLEANGDIYRLLTELCADPSTKIIFLPAALCDFEPYELEEQRMERPTHYMDVGKDEDRLHTANYDDSGLYLKMYPAAKIIPMVRKYRKDIFLVGFKTTADDTENSQYLRGLHLLKGSSCNLVLANDIKTRVNMVITPEEARYHVTTDRDEALRGLVEMAYLRSHLTFTRSTVIAGEPVPWNSPLIPEALRQVVDYCIHEGAYKPFRGATVGHFAAKLDATTFLTSRRKTNFNDLDKIGLVKIRTDGPDTVLAYGSKPSVGGQSQRIIFEEHPEYDCITHFHCPIRTGSDVPIVSQREYECGSHQCGQNTSRGLKKFGNLSAVYLDQHGPNIVFHHSIDPAEVMNFIELHFDLKGKTGGYVAPEPI